MEAKHGFMENLWFTAASEIGVRDFRRLWPLSKDKTRFGTQNLFEIPRRVSAVAFLKERTIATTLGRVVGGKVEWNVNRMHLSTHDGFA